MAWSPDDEYDQAEWRDLELALALLLGAWALQDRNDMRIPPDKRYLEDKSPQDREAREAIGRLLRSKKMLDTHLRNQLAELFDGGPPHSSFDGAPMARRITFEARRAGKMNETALRYLHIADDYRHLREAGTPHKETVWHICEKYDVKETTVKEARRAYPQLAPKAFKKLDGRPG